MKLKENNEIRICLVILWNFFCLLSHCKLEAQNPIPAQRSITFSNAFPTPQPITINGWFPDNTYSVELIHNGKRLALAPIISRGIFNSPEIKVSGSGVRNETFTLRLYKTEYGSFDAAVKASHTKPNLAFSMENFPAETGDPGSRAPTLEKAMANGKWKSFGLTDFDARTRNVIDLIAPVNVNIPGQGSGEITFSNVFGIPQLIEINGWKPDRNYTVELIHKEKSLAKTPIIFGGAFNSMERIPIDGADASEEIFTLRLYKTSYGSFEAAVRASGNESNTAFSLDDFPVMTGPARRPAPPPPGLSEGMAKARWKSYGLTDSGEKNDQPGINRYLLFTNRGLTRSPIIIDGFVPGSSYKVELVHEGKVLASTPIENRGFFHGNIVEIPGSDTPYQTVSLRLYHSHFENWQMAADESDDAAEVAYIMENIDVFARRERDGATTTKSGLPEGMRGGRWRRMSKGIPMPEKGVQQPGRGIPIGIIDFRNYDSGSNIVPLVIHGCPIDDKYRIEIVHGGKILGKADINSEGGFSGGFIRLPDPMTTTQAYSLRVYNKTFTNFQMAKENRSKIPNAAFSMDNIDLSPSSYLEPQIWKFSQLLTKNPWQNHGEYDPSRISSLSGELILSNRHPFESPVYIADLVLNNDYVIELELLNRLIARQPFIADGYFNSSKIKFPYTDNEIAEMNLHVYKNKYNNFREALLDIHPKNSPVYSLTNFMKISDPDGNVKGVHPNISSALLARQGEWAYTSGTSLGSTFSENASEGNFGRRLIIIAASVLILGILLIPVFMPYLR